MLQVLPINLSEEENEACAAPVAVQLETANVPKYLGPLKIKQNKIAKVAVVSPAAHGADVVVDLIHKIENLNKDDAIARLGELEDGHEQTYFEIGGVLSVIQKSEWFEPYASFDEWVEKNTAMRRSKARVLVQIYDAISNSGITWAKVEHIGWTKLRAVARVLKPGNADSWIEFASTHAKTEIIEHVRQELGTSCAPATSGSTGWRNKTFKLHDDQIEIVSVAIEKMKEKSETLHDSVALEFICQEYLAGQTLEQKLPHLSPDAMADVLTSIFKRYEKDALKDILKSALANFGGTLEVMEG